MSRSLRPTPATSGTGGKRRPAHGQGEPRPARFGSLDPEVVSDIALLREFMTNRHRHMVRLFGSALRQSPLRDELLRLLLMSFGQDRHQRISFYVRACSSYATEPSVRGEIDHFVAVELAVLIRDEEHPRASLLAPTERLVRFYNEQIPRLRSEAHLLLSGRRNGEG